MSSMPFLRPLGRTGITVPAICLGTMTWGQQNTEQDAHLQMDYALDQGINFWDTAELYAVPPSPETCGLTETYIGNWFKKTGRRKDVILASKITGPGLPWVREGLGITAAEVIPALDASLKRLQTDYLDLYQTHWPHRPTSRFQGFWRVDTKKEMYNAEVDRILSVLDVLNAQVKAGKIKSIGLSDDSAWGVFLHLHAASTKGMPRIASIQNEYSMLNRHFERELGEIAIFEDVGLLAWGVLADGILSGKYRNGARPKGSRVTFDPRGSYRLTPTVEKAVDAYIAVAQKHGLDVCEMATSWAMNQPFMTSVIVGATSLDQLKSNIRARDIKLTSDCLKDIDAVYKQYPMPF